MRSRSQEAGNNWFGSWTFLKTAQRTANKAGRLVEGAVKSAASELQEKGVDGVVSNLQNHVKDHGVLRSAVNAASAATHATQVAVAEIVDSDWMPAALKAMDKDDGAKFRGALCLGGHHKTQIFSQSGGGVWTLAQKLEEHVGYQTQAEAVEARRVRGIKSTFLLEAPAVLHGAMAQLAPTLQLGGEADSSSRAPWACAACTFENSTDVALCKMCDTVRQHHQSTTATTFTLEELAIYNKRPECIAVFEEIRDVCIEGAFVVNRDCAGGPIFTVDQVDHIDTMVDVAERGVSGASNRRVSPLQLQRFRCSHVQEAGVEKWGDSFVCMCCKQPFEDPSRIAVEAESLDRLLAQDLEAFGGDDLEEASGEASIQRGVTVEWLFSFTEQHDCWAWQTSRVRDQLVYAATAAARCRFTELAEVQHLVQRARVFVSHAWCACWGDLVAACCTMLPPHTTVWVDIFSVRQWPGDCSICSESCHTDLMC